MKTLLITFTLLIASYGFSQTWTYTSDYYADMGNPGGLNTQSDNPGQSIWTTIMPGPQAANVWSPNQTIPFAFEFYGNTVTQFKASQNGLVTFDVASALLPNVNDNLPSANLPDSTICGFWDEFTSNAPTGAGDDIRTVVFGNAPNRQLWIKWYSFEIGNPSSSFMYFSIVLEETTNNIYVVDLFDNSTTISATVGVQLNSTTAAQFGTNTINHGSNGLANGDNDYYAFEPLLLVSDNAGVNAMINPLVPLTQGLQSVDVTFQNYGTNDITSTLIDWEINGAPQTQFTYSGPTLAAGATSATISLGTYNFPAGTTDLKFWTSLPNGNADNNPLNDTLNISACTYLNGTYAIGGIGADYATIDAAVAALESCGVSGPVTFNITPGIYAENISLEEIIGASAVNTITFNGGSSNDVTMTHDGTGNPAVIAFNGGDYFTFKNMTIENTGAMDVWGVHLTDQSNYNTIDSCVILMDLLATTNVIGIVCSGDLYNDFSHGDAANYCTFSNNEIFGGEMGMHLEGVSSSGSWMTNISIVNNYIHGMDDYGIYMDNMDTITISGNTINELRSPSADGMSLYDIANFNISYNNITAPDYGIMIADGNFDFATSQQSKLVNNMVITETDYAIYLDDIKNIDVYHNTAVGYRGMRINDFNTLDIRNNLFVSNTGFAFESVDAIGPTNVLESNMYWTPASNALFVKVGNNTYADLASWQTASPLLNVNSQELEPFFTSASDLHRIGASGNDLGDNTVGVLDDIDGDARPLTPSTIVDFGADEYTPLTNDASVISAEPIALWTCGDSIVDIYVVIENLGTDVILTTPVAVSVTGDITTTLNGTYTGSIAFGESDTVLVGSINSYAGGMIYYSAWTELVGEQNFSNDTSWFGPVNFIPFEPIGINGTGCGVDSALIYGDTTYPVEYVWYDALVGGSIVGSGNSFMVPSIATQDTYFLSYTGIIDNITSTFAGGNGCGSGGNMFDVNSSTASNVIGFNVHSDEAVGTPVPVNVYYKSGSYIGSETTSGDWTLVGNYTVNSGGSGNPSDYLSLGANIPIVPGIPTGIYVEYDGEITNGSSIYTSGAYTITSGIGLCGSFASTTNNRIFNGTVYFEEPACSDFRTPVSSVAVTTPTLDLAGDTTTCGTQYTLMSGNSTPETILWSDGSTLEDLTVTSSGSFWVSVTDTTTGCVVTDTAAVIVDPLAVSIVSNIEICDGDSIILTPNVISVYDYSTIWSTGDTTLSINSGVTGAYTVTVSDTLGCSDMAVVNLNVILDVVAGFTVIQNSTEIDLTSSATAADSVVFDFGDGSSTVNGLNANHTYTANGTYTVCQIAYNQCSTDTTCSDVIITQVGLDEEALNAYKIFPNPAHDVITIQTQDVNANKIELLSADGKLIQSITPSGASTQITLNQLSTGVYLIRVDINGLTSVKRFVKN